MKISKEGFEKFRLALAKRESGDNYEIVNKYGFMGRYQFGKPRLFDFQISIDGYYPQKYIALPTTHKLMSKQDFLTDHDLQDHIFELHVLDLAKQLTYKFPGAVDRYSLSGLVAGAHLVGLGGVKRFLAGTIPQDAYGTKITDYIKLFYNYQLVETA